ncbi:MAG: hypothetical protein L0Z52_09525 [Acidobacteria bacterium]|nr:hypothetical protein [Acidobacteriota bacterium]
MNRKVATTTAILGFLLGGAAGYLVGSSGEFIRRGHKPSLEQETRRLEVEYPLALSRKPYLILDLLNSRLDYRLGGMTIKSLPIQIESIRERGKKGVLAPGRSTLLSIEDRGAPPEVIIPPDPNKPVDPLEDPKLFPPDPPTDFTLLFDHPVKVRFLGEKEGGWKSKMQGVGRAVSTWLPWGPGAGRKEIRVQLRLPAERAQEVYRALYRDEKVLVLGLGEESLTPGVNAK